MMSNNSINTPSILKKSLKIFAYVVGVLVTLFIVLLILASLMHVGTNSIQHITDFLKSSLWIVGLRWSIYAGIWFGWPWIAKFFSSSKRNADGEPRFSEDDLKIITDRSRRMMVFIMVVYEAMCWLQKIQY